MSVVSLENFTPVPRYDSTPWTEGQIQEGPTADGPWTNLENVVLSPVDPDPKQPLSRDFTTDQAVLTQGWYRILFKDGAGNGQPSLAIHNIPDSALPYIPTLDDVGALLRARTVNSVGVEVGTFTDTTRPTADQALAIVKQAARDLVLKVGPTIPEQYMEDAKQLVALRAAMLIELSYYPEQIRSRDSQYERYKELYDQGLPSLLDIVAGAEGSETDTESTGGMPHFGFPTDRGGLVGWDTVM